MNNTTSPTSRQYSLKHPCSECPFSRSCPPGLTGGSDPTVFVGQAAGPFHLACHQDRDYHPQTALQNAHILAQCAGAAIFRANTEVDDKMPGVVHRLPKDEERVFSNPAELISHHKGISVEEAGELLSQTPPHVLLMMEIRKLRPENYIVFTN